MTSPCNNPAEAAQPDEFFPACPTCHSQGRRCVNPDGSLAWPWHTSRAVLRDAEWLASDRVGMGFTDTLKDSTAHVAAYLAGVADARQGTVVVDPDAVLPDLIAALEILRESVAPRQ
jgi:hypothetical protein